MEFHGGNFMGEKRPPNVRNHEDRKTSPFCAQV